MKINERGKVYEEYVNKFIKGKDISKSCDWCDIETKTTMYEVKGSNIYNEKRNGLNYAHYKICPENHKLLKEKSEELKKKAKYVFVLKIDKHKIFKVCSWEMVQMIIGNGKKYFRKSHNNDIIYLHFKEVW